jgi:hypothetical protein
MGPKYRHPFFERFAVRRCIAQVALKSFHFILPLENSRKNIPQGLEFDGQGRELFVMGIYVKFCFALKTS